MAQTLHGSTVSTGKAAELCSVTPDAVLKWIKTGKIQATRTAGGHYRISKECLKPFLAEKAAAPLDAHRVVRGL